MKKIFLTFFVVLSGWISSAQQFFVQGSVTDGIKPLPNVSLQVENSFQEILTDASGNFSMELPQGTHILNISLSGYISQRMILEVTENLTLPTIVLQLDTIQELNTNVISLSESELEDDEGSADMVSGLLQSSRDVYFQRASFDFGQVFFRPRGYDSREANVLINGVPMAKIETGRANWSNWGGLNDMTRNQINTIGVQASEYDFGGIFGSNYISIRPSENREGLRFSATASNRTYTGRVMATYNSGLRNNKWAYSLSGSRRWANNGGYIDGMLYNAYAFAAAIEYRVNSHSAFNFAGIYSYNNRGKSAPLTQEVIALGGRYYNPNWGTQHGDVRNSRMKRIAEPIFILSHHYKKNDTKINTNIGYQFGQVGDTRIQYAKAQNPDPTYYTNMPSHYYNMNNPNDPSRHDPYALDKTYQQIQYFCNNSQLNWDKLYMANHNINGESIYVLGEDVIDTKTLTGNILASTKINSNIWLNAGATYQNIQTDNYQQINDLLGGKYFLNKSYYTGQWYNTTDEQLVEGDKYQYHYKAQIQKANAFGQLRFKYGRADFYIAGRYDYTGYERDGQFENNKTYTDSKGKSGVKYFNSVSTKAGLTYSITGRHILQFNAGYFEVPQALNAIFMNIRNSNSVIPFDIKAEIQTTADASYIIRMPYFKSRITGYVTKYQDVTDKNFFFVQARVGEESGGFLSETVTDIDKLHYGVEWGTEFQILPTLKATAVATWNKYYYTNNPTVIHSSDERLIGKPYISYMKNYRVAGTPQQAYSVGLEYRNPRYWWVGATANWFNDNYIDIAPFLRTTNIYLDPTTGSQFSNIDQEKVKEFLTQENLGSLFLVNLTAGKSWRIKGKYVSVFASVNNLLNKQFKTGGFEQARRGNYQAMVYERANGYPTFGNKYFVGYGTTYYVNMAVSF